MGFLIRFSKYTIVPILCEWLDFPDLGVLDSALCNKNDRNVWLSIISQHEKKFEETIHVEEVVMSSQLLNWITERCLKGRWLNKIILSDSFIRELNYNSKERIKAKFFNYLPVIKSIESTHCSVENLKSLANLIQNTPNLLKLKMIECIHIDGIISAVTNCQRLTSCNLSGSIGISQDFLCKLFRNNSELRDINLMGCRCLSTVVMRSMVVHCRNLKHLNLLYATETVYECDMMMLLMHNTGRRCLQSVSCLEHTDDTIAVLISYHGTSLRNLNLHYTEHIGDEALRYIGKFECCTSLLHLNLENNSDITNECLSVISLQVPLLQTINLKLARGLSNYVLSSFLQNCQELQELHLKSNSHINTSLDSIAEFGKGLTKLSLCDITSLTRKTLKNIVVKCNQLKYLDISNNSIVCDYWLLDISPSISQLNTLRLKSCKLITSQSLVAVSRYCRNLTEVSVDQCPLISDYGVIALLEVNHNIVKLDVGGCSLLTDSTLQCLIRCHHCKLVSLNIRNCKSMSPQSVCRLVQAIPRLRDLYIVQGQFIECEAKLRKFNQDLSIDINY